MTHMRLLRNILNACSCFLAIAILCPLLDGCSTGPAKEPHSGKGQSSDTAHHLRSDPLRVGDSIRIDFSGTPNPIVSIQTEIKGDGMVRLDLIGDVLADGETPGELERAIQAKYVPDYYTHLNVTVTPVVRYFYVDGEVNVSSSGGRIMYAGPITVTQAIASAGGFSPFADRRHVKLFRVNASSSINVNCVKALDDPKLDLPVYPGDKVVVKRRLY